MSEVEQFKRSCDEAADYPNNLIYHNAYDHVLKTAAQRLNEQEDRLFFDESNASLSFRDYDSHLKTFENIKFCGYNELQDYLSGRAAFDHIDPECRFVFVHAPHSRERLRTTRKMLMYTFTYHQVMPAFVDFLFPFGRQQRAQDFHFSGFRYEDRLLENERGLELRNIGRSGLDIRMCYNLKSVEPSKTHLDWPWSIRQMAIYHSFDVEFGKSFWTIVKGDQLMKKRMEAAVTPASGRRLRTCDSQPVAFASSLEAHLILFDWCREHWRWYMNFLEEGLQTSTRKTILVSFDKTSRQPVADVPQDSIQHVTSRVCSSPTLISEKSVIGSDSQIKYPPPYAPIQQRPPPPSTEQKNSTGESKDNSRNDDEPSVKDLQKVQFLEEKANEILLVLETNRNILSEVKDHYHMIFNSKAFPLGLKTGCSKDMTRFETETAAIINDLQMHQRRGEAVQRFLTNRKNLIYGILNIKNMESNERFMKRAQLSAESMESMTRDMHEIAHKTKQETVSMRIITLVTLFFLPGTFISTIMSTDILQYQTTDAGKSQEIFQLGALQMYLSITLPLMFLTFTAWYGVYWWVDRREAVRNREKKPKDMV